MRIAQVAPLTERCPPVLYGGTERVVSYLTEELVAMGHDVTLFASGDSITSAHLEACCERALRLDDSVMDPLPYHMMMLDEVMRRADEFDIIHFNVDLLHAPLVHRIEDRALTTLHGRLDLPDLPPFYARFSDLKLVSISMAQRRPIPNANWIANVPHGLPDDLLPFTAKPRDGYLAFLGRIAPEKRPDRAIEVAAATGRPLKIAAKIDAVDKLYWEEVIAPMVAAHPNVEFIGEISESEKGRFLGEAAALIFPIDWPEPFGLVMIEAMACGTPVVAFRAGSTPEVIDPGVTGFLVDSVDEAIEATEMCERLDRRRIRRTFDDRFGVARMAADYVNVYEGMLRGDFGRPPSSRMQAA